MDEIKAQTRLFKALMHPVRLEILKVLQEDEQCVCHMEAALGYRQAYISQHLSVLKDAGLIQDRREGWNIFYRVARPQVFDLIESAQLVIGDQGEEQKPKPHSKTKPCPCPKCNEVAK